MSRSGKGSNVGKDEGDEMDEDQSEAHHGKIRVRILNVRT